MKKKLVNKTFYKGRIFSCLFEQNHLLTSGSIIENNSSMDRFNMSDFRLHFEAINMNSSLEEVFVNQALTKITDYEDEEK